MCIDAQWCKLHRTKSNIQAYNAMNNTVNSGSFSASSPIILSSFKHLSLPELQMFLLSLPAVTHVALIGNSKRHNTIFRPRVGTGVGKDMEPDVTWRGDLFLVALRARFEWVPTAWWNFEVSYGGQLSLQWQIVVELNKAQNMLEEVKSMKACVGVLWYRCVNLMMVFIDTPRGLTKYQETRTLWLRADPSRSQSRKHRKQHALGAFTAGKCSQLLSDP
ncbi:hypothetical protein C8R41DRAFT_867377 [Lentinula lateritia]|uniref:Uncharacterized protein n=1 Tax=Lentinula lateritia TaxID=40482 RepID=A0ABQ8VKF1_9AGAR|nr:hypothetical protein C8R41DRAFT_867377 [Lentinula lateritia]